MKERYFVIIDGGYDGYSRSEDFSTLQEAVDYAVQNSYGKNFEIAKKVYWEIKEL